MPDKRAATLDYESPREDETPRSITTGFIWGWMIGAIVGTLVANLLSDGLGETSFVLFFLTVASGVIMLGVTQIVADRWPIGKVFAFVFALVTSAALPSGLMYGLLYAILSGGGS